MKHQIIFLRKTDRAMRLLQAPSNEDAIKLGLVVLSAVREFTALDTSALNKFIHV